MRSQEFFSSGRETASPGEEMHIPKQEFAAPGSEHFSIGSERLDMGRETHHEIDGTVRKKKKRRVSSLVFTAAAVTTAVITISGVNTGHTEPKTDYPLCEITEVQQAYLDEVWAAVEQGEVDQMTELANDIRLRDLVVEYIQPYAHRAEEAYGLSVIWTENYYNNDTLLTNEEGGHYYVYYDGEYLGTWEALGEPYETPVLWLEYSKQGEYFSATFAVAQRKARSAGEQWQEKLFDYRSAISGEYERTLWYDRLIEHVQRGDAAMDAAAGGVFLERATWSDSTGIYRMEEITLDGDAQIVIAGENLSSLGSYLENGTVQYRYIEDGRSSEVTLEVRDGWTILNDRITVEPTGDIGYHLVLDGDRVIWSNTMTNLVSGTAEEFLFHLFEYRSFSSMGL